MSRTLLRSAGLAVALLALAAGSAQAKPGPPAADQITSGARYDRNPVLVRDRAADLLFFTRTQQACNRLQGCVADNSDYDLYVQKLGRKGGAPTLVATNPGPAGLFRGRTVAATRTRDGTVHVFWSSGGNAGVLYHLSRGRKDATFSAPEPVAVANDGVFNVEAVADRNDVYVYTEECCTPHGIYAYRYAGGALTDKTEVALGQSIPKVIIDKRGTFRMAMTDSDVSVASSTDGLHFSAPDEVVSDAGAVTNWDPSLAQDESGIFLLSYAPDQGDGNQRIEVAGSFDFEHWSSGRAVTSPDGWWDYWPEANLAGGAADLYFTSERPVGSAAAGTGHIWSISAR